MNSIRKRLRSTGLVILIYAASISAGHSADGLDCMASAGQWLSPGSGAKFSGVDVQDEAAGSPIVLLGEAHTSMDHHRWQLQVLAGLHSRNPGIIIGLEMFPRRVQSVLDAWTEGRLDEREFLEQSAWNEVWGYDPDLYLPLFHFARMNRIRMVAINVDRDLVSQVAEQGWDAVPDEQREGLSDPIPASEDYRRSLAELYTQKQSMGIIHSDEQPGVEKPELDAVLSDPEFSKFVEAQLTWDRAMAEGLFSEYSQAPGRIIVGIVGRGHIEHGYGIPHQLRDLGVEKVSVLLPVNAASDCSALAGDLADAVFVVDEQEREDSPKPRLGVHIRDAEDGVVVMEVVDGSIARAAGIMEGDIIRLAAGFETRDVSTLLDVIQRQAPGTWLPLEIRRGDQTIDVTAKFPQQFD